MPGRGRCRPEVALTPLAWDGVAGAVQRMVPGAAGAGNRRLGKPYPRKHNSLLDRGGVLCSETQISSFWHLKNISSFLNPASGSWAVTKTSVRRRRPSRNQHKRDVTQGVHGHGSVRGFARQLYILMPCLPQRYLFLRSFVFFSFLIEKKPGDIC